MSEFSPPCVARVRLTVRVPFACEDRVVDWLLAQADTKAEFSVQHVVLRGASVRLLSNEEHVSGFVRCSNVELLMERAPIDALIAGLGDLLAGIAVSYWVTSVELSGSVGGPA